MAESRISELYGKKTDGFEIVEKFKGKSLEGVEYEPLFDFFVEDYPKAFRILCDTYVTSDAGTGVVH